MREPQIRGSGTITIEGMVGVRITKDPSLHFEYVHLGDHHMLQFYPGQMRLLALAMMAYVEAQEARAIAKQSAEDWDAERTDAEAL